MLVAWTVFYVHAHQITDSFVRFSIKTIEGDESLIEHVVIRGDMSSSNFTYEPFVLTKDGTTFMRETSFIERISDYHKSEKVKQLQLKHRQFMRQERKQRQLRNDGRQNRVRRFHLFQIQLRSEKVKIKRSTKIRTKRKQR